MSNWDPENPDLAELANLPRGDSRRQAFEDDLANADASQQEYWRTIMRETDHLSAEFSRLDVPPNLQARLMQIAAPPVAPKRAGWMNIQISWKHLLGGAVAAAILAGAYFLFEPKPARMVALDDSFADEIGTQAVQTHESQTPLQITNTDPHVVETALTQDKMPFPVAVLQPNFHLDLVGGGTCDMAGTPAVYTRWRKDGDNYTLLEFDGRRIGIPAEFYRRIDVPQKLWHDTHHYRVVLWPGNSGECTWALVLESDNAKDAFSQAAY